MTRNERAEESKQNNLKIIQGYMETEKCFDILLYAKKPTNGATPVLNKKFHKWLEFAKENLSKEEYAKFVKKALPFEAYGDDSNIQEKEEFKLKVENLAMRVFKNEANLIEIYDEIGPDIAKYMYMLKQLRFRYNSIAAHVYTKNSDYCYEACRYNYRGVSSNLEFVNLSDEQRKKIKKIISDRDMPFNDITYNAAYRYALRKGIVSLNPRK